MSKLLKILGLHQVEVVLHTLHTNPEGIGNGLEECDDIERKTGIPHSSVLETARKAYQYYKTSRPTKWSKVISNLVQHYDPKPPQPYQ